MKPAFIIDPSREAAGYTDEANDCLVRSLKHALNVKYHSAHLLVEVLFHRIPGRGVHNVYRMPNGHYVRGEYLDYLNNKFKPIIKPTNYTPWCGWETYSTVAKILPLLDHHKKYLMVINGGAHIAPIIYGHIIDREPWNALHLHHVCGLWEVE